jgi:hypothetical protein
MIFFHLILPVRKEEKMTRRKLKESQKRVYRNIGILAQDYERILTEDKRTGKGIAVIVAESLNHYFIKNNKKVFS